MEDSALRQESLRRETLRYEAELRSKTETKRAEVEIQLQARTAWINAFSRAKHNIRASEVVAALLLDPCGDSYCERHVAALISCASGLS